MAWHLEKTSREFVLTQGVQETPQNVHLYASLAKNNILATPPRLERGTCGLEDRCTIQLCYGAAKAVRKTVRREQLSAFPILFQHHITA